MIEKSSKISSENTIPKIRRAKFAGTWYPGTKEELAATIKDYMDKVKLPSLAHSVKAIIVPHAGYYYSGQTASHAFKSIATKYDNVFLLGPSHRYPLRDASIMNVSHYETPLGKIPLSKIAEELRKHENILSIDDAHANEHSLEIELPFIQYQLNDFQLIPMLIGDIDHNILQEQIQTHLTDKDLIVVSADLSHFHTFEKAQELDNFTIKAILDLDTERIFQAEIDAPHAIATLLEIAKAKGWTPKLLDYKNSGHISGDKSQVVGYAAIVFT